MTTPDDEVDWEAVEACVDAFTQVVRHHLAGLTAPTDAGHTRPGSPLLVSNSAWTVPPNTSVWVMFIPTSTSSS